MMQDNDKYFEELYRYVGEQRQHVSQLLRFLAERSGEEVGTVKGGDALEPPPISMKEIRQKLEQRTAMVKCKSQPLGEELSVCLHQLFGGEKETPFSIYQKLMQLLQKWTELQLAILKEWQKNKEETHASPATMGFEEEDKLILQQFFMSQQEAQD